METAAPAIAAPADETRAPMIWPPSKATSIRTRSVSDNCNHLREYAVDGIRMDEGNLEAYARLDQLSDLHQ